MMNILGRLGCFLSLCHTDTLVSGYSRTTRNMNQIFLLLLLCTAVASGQVDSELEAKILFEKAKLLSESIYEDKNYDITYFSENQFFGDSIRTILNTKKLETLSYYSKIISSYSDSKYVVESILQSANLQFELSNNEDAKNLYQKVVHHSKGKPTKKYVALMELAIIAIQEKNFKLSLNYLKESKNHKPFFSCGNAYDGEAQYIQQLEDICYKELGINQ